MSLLLDSGPRKRLIVLGLDGLPLDLARKLGALLPNLGRIAGEATSVRAEIPELSPVNWTSFFTGKGPEEHGVFGFSHIDPATYRLRIINSEDISSPTVFDRLGEGGLVSRFINLPNTYPVRPLRGMGISGFVSNDLEHAAYPPFLRSRLAEEDYRLEADTNRGITDIDYLLDQLRETLRSRLTALDMLWPDLGWDLFIHVFTETDRLFHFFMDAVVHPDHPHHLACMGFLADWDHALGQFLVRYDALPAPKRLLVMADHGFAEIKTEVCINTWLKKEGFLSLGAHPGDEWDLTGITNESKAFALDPGRIYIHRKDRFIRGAVRNRDVQAVAEQIANGLSRLTFQGEPVMEAVHTGGDLYPGATSDQTPDMICQPRPGFDLKAKSDRNDIFGLHGRTGTHTVDGAIFLDTFGSHPKRIRDIGQTILQHFDILE